MKKIFNLLVALFLLVSCDNTKETGLPSEESLVKLQLAIEKAHAAFELQNSDSVERVAARNEVFDLRREIITLSQKIAPYEADNEVAKSLNLARDFLRKEARSYQRNLFEQAEEDLMNYQNILNEMKASENPLILRDIPDAEKRVSELEAELYAQRVDYERVRAKDYDPLAR